MTIWNRAFVSIGDLVQNKMREANLPGWAIAVTNRDQVLWTESFGYGNIATKDPVRPDSLFEIGSIGKSFTCIALLQLKESGTLDLQAPVTKYLPWFQVRTRYSPITVHHLMRHTAGIIRGTEQAPYGLYDAWALRETATSAPPGEHWHYSSVGYKVLGFLLEKLTGQTYPEVIQSRILDLLQMTQSYPAVTFQTRKISTVGYRGFYDDRPQHPSYALAPAFWSEYATADGCQVSTVQDIAKFVRMLLNRGMGPAGRLLSEESYAALTQPELAAGNDYYSYALAVYPRNGYRLVGHGGATTGYNNCIMTDPEIGLGIVSLVNKMEESDAVEATTLQAMDIVRAAYQQRDLPPPPTPSSPRLVPNAADYAGIYRWGDEELRLTAQGSQLLLRYKDESIVLERRSEDAFYLSHPEFHLFLLEFQRHEGRVVEAFHGARWYRGDHYSGPQQFEYPQEWEAYRGHYRARNPELSNFRIAIRKGSLVLIFPWCLVETLTSLGDSKFRIGRDERSPETLQFHQAVEGRVLRVDFSGCPYYRTFTP